MEFDHSHCSQSANDRGSCYTAFRMELAILIDNQESRQARCQDFRRGWGVSAVVAIEAHGSTEPRRYGTRYHTRRDQLDVVDQEQIIQFNL
jgi:hypothetical protein